MQPNKTKISLIIGAMFLGVSGASMAASESFNITATTIADVTIDEETALDFGANIFTTVGNCSMVGNDPTDANIRLEDGTASGGSTQGALSGTSCIAGNTGTPGLYKITGAGNTNVSLSLGSISTAEFTFVPDSSAYTIYNNGAAGDLLGTNLSTTAPNTGLLIASAADAGGLAIVNQLWFTLGGTLDILTPLTPQTIYNAETFTVTVTY